MYSKARRFMPINKKEKKNSELLNFKIIFNIGNLLVSGCCTFNALMMVFGFSRMYVCKLTISYTEGNLNTYLSKSVTRPTFRNGLCSLR